MFGGEDVFVSGETWELHADPSERPTVMVALDQRGVIPTNGAITGLSIEAIGGARGNTTTIPGVGQSMDGAELLAWDAAIGEWVSLAVNDRGLDAPASLAYETRTATTAERFIAGDGQLHLLVQPRFGLGNGSVMPEVKLSYIEVTIQSAR